MKTKNIKMARNAAADESQAVVAGEVITARSFAPQAAPDGLQINLQFDFPAAGKYQPQTSANLEVWENEGLPLVLPGQMTAGIPIPMSTGKWLQFVYVGA